MQSFQEIIATAKAATVPHEITAEVDGVKVQLLAIEKSSNGAGTELVDLHDYIEGRLPRPVRKSGSIAFTDLADIIAYTNREIAPAQTPTLPSELEKAGITPKPSKCGSTIAFMDSKNGAVSVIFNHHDAGPEGQQWGDFEATYKPVFSKPWNAWTGTTNWLDLAAFSAFVEDHITDIGEPPPASGGTEADKELRELAKLYGSHYASRADLIGVSKGFKVHVKEEVENVLDQTGGQLQVLWKTEHTGQRGGPVKFDGMFILAIPVFDRGDHFRLPVRLKYRVNEGKLFFSFAVINQDLAQTTAIEDIRKKVAAETKLPVFYGKP